MDEETRGELIERYRRGFTLVEEGDDENAFAARLHYADRPIEAALAAFRAARETTSQLFETMTGDDWAREGTHTESGRYTAEDWLRATAAHAYDHGAQIRAALG
ncbi:MAG TPA: DinB family protein [Actinomycetota bacterium]|nr:DinB family protein [Actinomycetota bacterium]